MGLRLALDIDGVLADLVGTFLPLLGRHAGREFARGDVTVFNFDEALGLPPNTSRDLMEEVFADGMLTRLHPMPGAVDGVAYLRAKYDTLIVTNRPAEYIEETQDWLGSVGITGVTVTKLDCSRKSDCPPVDCLVDDRWAIARECGVNVRRVILLNSPWNVRPDPLPPAVVRVDDWPGICAAVDELAAEMASGSQEARQDA